MKTKYLILFLILALIFNLGLACGEVSIEEDTKVDIEEKYLSELNLLALAMSDNVKKLGQASSDYSDGKISIPGHKVITIKYIKEVKGYYDMYLELNPSKRLETSHDLFGKAMDHTLRGAMLLQNYIDTNDIEKMTGYLGQANAEMDIATEYILKSVEERNKLTE